MLILTPLQTICKIIHVFNEKNVFKSAQIRSIFWSVLSPNAGKYGSKNAPYLDTFHAVILLYWTVDMTIVTVNIQYWPNLITSIVFLFKYYFDHAIKFFSCAVFKPYTRKETIIINSFTWFLSYETDADFSQQMDEF